MAFLVADRVRENSVTTGTGTLNLTGSPIGYQTFLSAIGSGNSTYYVISNPGVNEWEVGIGTVGAGTLARTTVLASSTGTSLVSFTAGTKDVFVTYPAEVAVFAGNAVTLTNKTISGSDNTLSNIGNGSLTNSSLTIGTTNIALGATSLTLAGLTSVTATTFNGALSGNATTATTATNLAGGAASQIPYQTGSGATTFLANGTSGQVLTSNGASAPSWGSNAITLGSTTVTLGGTAGSIAGLTSLSSTGVTVTSLTSGRVVYATTGGALADSVNLTFDGTTLALTGVLTVTQDSTFSSTGALKISSGTTAQRPSGTAGQLRFNTTTNEFEGYNGTAWASVGGSAISNDTTTASNLYPIFVNATTGTAANVFTSNAKYLYNPATGALQAPELVANNGMLVHANTVTANYDIPANYNAIAAGPVSVAAGVTVTVPSGSNWTVV